MDAIRDMCPMRHPNNGNCLPAGGFCTAVSDSICEALHSAYDLGGFDFLRHVKFDAEVTSTEAAPTLKNLASRITSEIKALRVDATPAAEPAQSLYVAPEQSVPAAVPAVPAAEGAVSGEPAPGEQKKSKAVLPFCQFRFGDVAFFISQVELDRLNEKYAEYIDSGAILEGSFANYLLKGVENHD